mgnify:CR=1 FL=1
MVLLYLSCLYHVQSEEKIHRPEKYKKGRQVPEKGVGSGSSKTWKICYKYYKYFKRKAADLWQRMQATPKEEETRLS